MRRKSTTEPADETPAVTEPPPDPHASVAADSPADPAPPLSAVHFTRAAALWSAVVLGFLVLIVLLIFIAQNTESSQIAFLGWTASLPLGVAIAGAAVLGGLVTVMVGMTRIIQLRRAAKQNLKGGRIR